MKFHEQMRILLWKNWMLKKRSPLNTVMELFLPLFIFALLIVIRSNVQPIPHPSKFPPTRALPSAGLLPMIQSFCDGGVDDQEGFRTQPNSFVDTVMTLLDGITKLTDGEWPPIPIVNHGPQIYNEGPQSQGPGPEGPQKTGPDRKKRRAVPLNDDYGASNDYSQMMNDPASLTRLLQSFDGDGMEQILNLGERAMKGNLRQGLDVYDQVKRLSSKQASFVNVNPYTTYAAGNTTHNSSLPKQCARYGLQTNGSESDSDWFKSLVNLWKGTEVFLCMNPTPEGEERQGFLPQFDTDSFQFGGAGGINFDELPIQDMVLNALKNNPKITYSPNGTDADLIIDQVINFLEIFNDLTRLASQWISQSPSIRQRVDPNGTVQAARDEKIKDHTYPGKDDPKPGVPVFNKTTIQEMIIAVVDALDYMSCYWLSLVNGGETIDFDDVFKGLPSEEALEKYSTEDAAKEGVTVLAGIVFEVNEDGSIPNHLTYKIRQNATISPTTKMTKDLIWEPGSDIRGEMYLYNGFVVLQDLVERGAITVMTGTIIMEPGIYIQEFPSPCFISDDIKLVLIEHMFPLALILGWVFLISMLVRGIVYEKEQRLKEVMRLMGLKDSVHWLAWFTTYLVEITISVTALVILLNMGNILTYTDPVLLWCIFFIYALNTIFFSFLVSVFFNKAKIASAVGGIAYILTYVPYMMISIFQNAGYPQSVWVKAPCSFFAPTGMGLTASYFNLYETIGTGLTFDNFMESGSAQDAYNPFLASMMSLISSAVYIILVWYIDNVFPGEYGLPKPWYFFITPTYWCGRPAMKEEKTCTSKLPSWMKSTLVKMGWLSAQGVAEEMLREARQNSSTANPTYFEEEPKELDLTIAIKDLSKVYSNGKLALDSLTLNMYEGQILSFLGHNGAGKTTTMSILTGMIPASSGTAIINGLDIRTDMHEIRRSLGMCPQHNVLFESLTVDEHLQFYARLKGTPLGAIDLEIENMLDETGLRQKRYSNVFSLSGGMKRKLSIGIAFISGSRAVILDEPTAGVDPWSRRDIWDLILRCKEGRTIMMSTHHMDEADVLGDRIAVISHGTLKCTGSSLFLKGTFGEGYHLIVTKKLSPAPLTDLQSAENILHEEGTTESTSTVTRCTERAISLFISALIQDSYLKAETPLELHYILPFDAIKNGTAGKLFDKLDENLRKLHLTGYGVSDTSLEEVFLKVTAYSKKSFVNGSSDNQALLKVSNRKLDKRRRSSPGIQRSFSEDCRHDGDPTQLVDSLGRVYTADPIARTHLRSSDRSLGGRQRRGSQGEKDGKPSTTEVPVRLRAMSWDVSVSAPLAQENEMRRVSDIEDPPRATGRYKMTGCCLWLHQFETSLYKRVILTGRNWKALFTQIALPALFVVIAMVLGLIGGPTVQDEPPLELSTAQYLNETKAREHNYVPFSDHRDYHWSYDAMPDDLSLTFKMPSGVGATCVLISPYNAANVTYDEACDKVLYSDGVLQSAFTLEGYDPNAPLNGTTPPEVPEGVSPNYYPECHCTTDNRALVCEDSQTHSKAPEFQVITSDVMVNVTGQNETAYFYYTANDYRMSRYGATTFGYKRKHVPYWLVTLQNQLKHLYVARVAKAWYNSRGWHSMPTYVNAINNAILRANLMTNKSFTGNPAAYGITVINHPMAGVGFASASSLIFGAELIIAIMMLVGFAFIPAGFLVFLVLERSTNAKHLEFVSGLNPLVYWLSNLVWDWLVYLLPVLFCAAVLAAFQLPAFTEGQNYLATCLLLLVFGWGTIPTMYPMSFVFKDASTAYVVMACFNIFTGCALLFVTFMMDYMGGTEEIQATSHTLKKAFLIFPGYALGRGLMDIVLTKTVNEVNAMLPDSHGPVELIGPFDWEVTGRNMACLAGVGAFFYILTILIEYGFFVKPSVMAAEDMPEIGKEDPDVARERKRVKTGGASESVVKLENLTKFYKTVKLGKMLAVQRLSLGIPRGECFGMLGVNGAGKTSTFKMLTGDHPASGGDATIAGHSILSDMNHVRRNIGYCPQFDALFEELTARQHLKLYSLLRGIPKADVDKVVTWALKKLELTEYADRPAGTYSGGNRRKLSTAIALLGDPPVIFLDEPTAGMDPYAKRFLWDLVLTLVEEGKCVILTSHSMEECETLCTRLAIMVQGRFRCMGSVQHLKSRFGDGYNIKITVKGPDYNGDITRLIKYMGANLPNANLKERHFNMVEFELPPEHVQLSDIFSKMERGRDELNVEDYSVCQNTLDNVFINFVNEQNKLLSDSAMAKRRRRSAKQEDHPLLEPKLSMRTDGCDNEAFVLENGTGSRDRIHSFVSDDLNIDELEEHGTSIHLNTKV